MADKISKKDIDTAVAKLVLPDFILKGAEEHMNAFKSRNKLVIREKAEDKKDRIDNLIENFNSNENGGSNLAYIFDLFYSYSDGVDGYSELEKIVDDIHKKLNSLKSASPDAFEAAERLKKEAEKEAQQDYDATEIPQDDIKECRKLKKSFDAAVKKWGSTSIISGRKGTLFAMTLKRRVDPKDLEKQVIPHVKWILAAYKFYAGVSGDNTKKLKQMAESVSREAHNMKGVTLKLDDLTTTYWSNVNSPADISKLGPNEVPIIKFGRIELGVTSYKKAYEVFLNEAYDLYRLYHNQFSALEKRIRFDPKEDRILHEAIKETHGCLKKVRHLLSMQKDLEKMTNKDALLKRQLKSAFKKFSNPNLEATVSMYSDDFKIMSSTAKFGEKVGHSIANGKRILDNYANAIHAFILPFSTSTSSIEDLLKAIENLNTQKGSVNKVTELSQNLNSGEQHKLSAKEANEDIKKLHAFSLKMTKELKGWDKIYDEFIEKMNEFEKENSNTAKVTEVAKIVALIAALALGVANISVGKNGVTVNSGK